MNNLELAAKAKDVATNYKTLYVLGCFGAPMNSSNKKRYTSNYPYNAEATRKKMIESASADTFGFDCVCFIKGLLWGWNGDVNREYGGATYKSNGVPDIGANEIIKVCKDVSTDFTHIEVGELCWMEGHVGLYVGDGLSVECTPRWTNNVQFTACNQSLSGYNKRTWTKHGKLPYITYVKSEETKSDKPATKSLDEIAWEVIDGKWGNGEQRKQALTAAGYDYKAVQSRVNELVKSGAQRPTQPAPAVDTDMTKYVDWLNSTYKFKLDKAKGWTEEVRKASIKAYQITTNRLYATSLIEDGVFKYEDYLEASAHPIKKGDKGNLVYIVQAALLQAGSDPKGIDGSYGTNTQAAVKSFQLKNNMASTGTCDADCLTLLFGYNLKDLTPGPNYMVKESLCLRESPINGNVLVVMPPEAKVVKLTNPWVKVSYEENGKVIEGWASMNYLIRI